MSYKILKLSAGILLSVCALNANASETHYFGVGIGNSSYDLTDNGLFELEDGSAFRLFGGIRKNNLGGEIELSFAGYDWKNSNGQATHNVSNLMISGLGFVPVSDVLDVYGKFGFNSWSTDVDFLGTNYEGDTGLGVAYGVGISFAGTNAINLRLEYQILTGLGDGVDKGDISQLMFDIAFQY